MTLQDLIKAALKEDMPQGDITTDSLALAPRQGRAKLIAKQDLILSGIECFEQTVHTLEPQMKMLWQFENGQKILQSQVVGSLFGDMIQLLKAERIALNFLGHLSGIATLTQKFVDQVSHTSTRILDTRKTLPGYRLLEKRAVVHGGGLNHRLNLSEALLIKDNHINIMGGVIEAIQRVRKSSPHLPIEIEARTLPEVEMAVKGLVQRILLDNMDNDTLKKALQLIPNNIQTEASGNMSLERVKSVAELGVDFISVGALTHSAPTADFSLIFEWEKSNHEHNHSSN